MAKQMKALAEDPVAFNSVLTVMQQIFSQASSGVISTYVHVGENEEEMDQILDFLMVQGFDYRVQGPCIHISWDNPGEW